MKWLRWLFNLFNKPKLILPHPEEPENPSQTMENTDIAKVIINWLTYWGVPLEYWIFWQKKIEIELVSHIWVNGQDAPAGSSDKTDGRLLVVRPSWLNPGVIAHEQAHNSYSLLPLTDRSGFVETYEEVKNDPLIKLLLSQKSQAMYNYVEIHAEVYRYLGERMPKRLKQYYPNLF